MVEVEVPMKDDARTQPTAPTQMDSSNGSPTTSVSSDLTLRQVRPASLEGFIEDVLCSLRAALSTLCLGLLITMRRDSVVRVATLQQDRDLLPTRTALLLASGLAASLPTLSTASPSMLSGLIAAIGTPEPWLSSLGPALLAFLVAHSAGTHVLRLVNRGSRFDPSAVLGLTVASCSVVAWLCLYVPLHTDVRAAAALLVFLVPAIVAGRSYAYQATGASSAKSSLGRSLRLTAPFIFVGTAVLALSLQSALEMAVAAWQRLTPAAAAPDLPSYQADIHALGCRAQQDFIHCTGVLRTPRGDSLVGNLDTVRFTWDVTEPELDVLELLHLTGSGSAFVQAYPVIAPAGFWRMPSDGIEGVSLRIRTTALCPIVDRLASLASALRPGDTNLRRLGVSLGWSSGWDPQAGKKLTLRGTGLLEDPHAFISALSRSCKQQQQ